MRERFGQSTRVPADTLRLRVFIIAFLLTAWILIIGARLTYLQTVQHDWLSEYARTQHQMMLEIDPMRGLILDTNGRELARSVDATSIFAVPGEVKDIERTVAQLAKVLKIESALLLDKLQQGKEANKKFIWIARKLEPEQASKLKALSLTGIHTIKEPKRYYPHGHMAAHVLGFVGLDDVGLGGIEQVKNSLLTGKEGKIFIDKDGTRRAYNSVEYKPYAGRTIVLTLNQTIQYWTEQALSKAIQRTRSTSGTAIVLKPSTGEILALANVPTFDPNNALRPSLEDRANSAVQTIYEPGSTFKIVAYAAAIEKGLAKPDEHIDCQMGAITIAGRVINDHHPYSTLTLTEALAKSSNVAAIKLGMRVGNETMYDYIKRFGFGSRTGIELPGESAGLLRPVGSWQTSSIGSIAIGQEVGVTPLQVASAFGVLANNGVYITPHIVRETRNEDGLLISKTSPESRRVISADTAKALRGMLEDVTLRGTAKLAQVDGYSAAGKTGTAQKVDPRTRGYSKSKYIASFVGFAPVNDPSVVILVVLDEPKGAYHGGEVAAPVFREIAERVLPILNVVPDTELDSFMAKSIDEENQSEEREGKQHLPEVDKPSSDKDEIVYAATDGNALLMPDLKGKSVRDVARVCAQLGLQLKASGDGRAISQRPNAGLNVRAGQTVQVKFDQ
jgi:cell division protein FtsI (penicillin-binding protein 3)